MARKAKTQTPSEFLDTLQTAITDLLKGGEAADKLKAVTAGINLAKVRAQIGDDEDEDGMGFAQR